MHIYLKNTSEYTYILETETQYQTENQGNNVVDNIILFDFLITSTG